LKESKAIDTEELCVISGKRVWSIRVEITVLDNNGNIFDCATMGTMAALHHFRRPEVSVQGDNVIVHSESEREPVPLSVHHTPVSISFVFFHGGDVMIADPLLKEEIFMDGRMTLMLNEFSELCLVEHAGGSPIGVEQILHCSKIATAKALEVVGVIKNGVNTSLRQKAQASRELPEQQQPGNAQKRKTAE
jgi:exosome complex component RRP45